MTTENAHTDSHDSRDAHAAHDVGQDWADTIIDLTARGFSAGTLQHALRLAGVYVQEYDSNTDDADERRIIDWEKDHRVPYSATHVNSILDTDTDNGIESGIG